MYKRQEITQCHLLLNTSKHATLTPARQTQFAYLEGWKAELTYVTGYILRWFIRPQMVTHPSTNPAVHGRELNSQPVDHKSDAPNHYTAKPAFSLLLSAAVYWQSFHHNEFELRAFWLLCQDGRYAIQAKTTLNTFESCEQLLEHYQKHPFQHENVGDITLGEVRRIMCHSYS